MGAVISRWRTKPSTVDVLEGIDKNIQTLEDYSKQNQRQLKIWVGRLLLYSSLLYLITCAIVYSWYLPEQLTEQLVLFLPFVIFPLLVWLLRKMLIALFSRRTKTNSEKLDDLKSQKRKILEEVMETETYKNAKMILERFDPDSRRNIELESTPIGPQMTPKPGQELRHRNIPNTPVAGNPTSSAGARPPLAAGPNISGRASHSAPGGPPERVLSALAAQQSLMRKSMTPGTPVLGVGLHPPGPPLVRPVLPRERGALDRVIEYLVGDGPQNRYALVCQQCVSHNGMALKEEFEYVAFRCAYCFFLNPARKTRPQAPRLPEATAERNILSEAHLTSSDTAAADNQPTSGQADVEDAEKDSAEKDVKEPGHPSTDHSSTSGEESASESPKLRSETSDGDHDSEVHK